MVKRPIFRQKEQLPTRADVGRNQDWKSVYAGPVETDSRASTGPLTLLGIDGKIEYTLMGIIRPQESVGSLNDSDMETEVFRRLLIATRNPGKVREYRQLLQDIPFEVTSLDEVGVVDEVEETGSTFEANACIKTRAYAASSGLLTLADDSGLEVDALGGSPGVRSARYGGPGLTDEGRVALLLANMENVKWEDRGGRFRCVIAIAWPSGKLETTTGAVEGIIQHEPKGTNGFGYDPIFYLPHLGRTMAELPLEEKNILSHRAQAAGKAATLLKAYLMKDSG